MLVGSLGILYLEPDIHLLGRESMKARTIFLLAVFIFTGHSGLFADIKFLRGSLVEATAKAEAEKKPIMIDFITDWCRWCDTLDAQTYSDQRVADFVNASIVSIKIDAEKGEGIDIAKRYGVNAYPTILVIKANGDEIDRILGYVPAEPFLNTITDYVNGRNTISSLRADLGKTPNDPALNYAMASKYQDRNDAPRAAEHFQKVLDADPSNGLGHNEEAQYAVALATFRSTKDPSRLVSFIDRYPESDMVRQALASIWRSSIKEKDGENARKFFLQTMEKFPNDAGLMNNYAWNCAEQKINLNHAAEVAKNAVGLADTDGKRAGYLDTQATVEFTRGNAKQAIALEQQALDLVKDAPAKTRKPYEDSMAKFKAGTASSSTK